MLGRRDHMLDARSSTRYELRDMPHQRGAPLESGRKKPRMPGLATWRRKNTRQAAMISPCVRTGACERSRLVQRPQLARIPTNPQRRAIGDRSPRASLGHSMVERSDGGARSPTRETGWNGGGRLWTQRPRARQRLTAGARPLVRRSGSRDRAVWARNHEADPLRAQTLARVHRGA